MMITSSNKADPIQKRDLFYHRERNRHRAHSSLLGLFKRLAQALGLKQTDLASRTGKDPAQIARIFNGQKNITLDTLSDLFLGMGYEVEYRAVPIGSQQGATGISWADHNRKETRPPLRTRNASGASVALLVSNG